MRDNSKDLVEYYVAITYAASPMTANLAGSERAILDLPVMPASPTVPALCHCRMTFTDIERTREL